MSDAAQDYQRQIAKTPKLGNDLLVEYRVTDPKTGETALLDGCAFWSEKRELLETKYGYGSLLDFASRQVAKQAEKMARGEKVKPFELKAANEAIDEALRQARAVGTEHPVEWHVSDHRALTFFENAVKEGAESPNFSVVLTPVR